MKLASALLLTAAALASVESRAAYITIDDSIPATIGFSAGDFEVGLALNGFAFQDGLGSSNTQTLAVADGTIFFIGEWISLGAPEPEDHTWYIINPSNPTVVDDILHVEYSTDQEFFGVIVGSFQPNVNLPLPELSLHESFFFEGPTPLDFSAPFSGNIVTFGNEEEAPVPEVQTYASLFGAALIGAQVWRRKRAA